MKQRIELSRYPLVIEPTINVLEILVKVRRVGRSPDDEPKSCWTTFHRLTNRSEFPRSEDNHTPNLFGDHPDQSQCKLVLGYETTGCIAAIYYRCGGEWVGESIPEEATGAFLRYPSCRVIFGSKKELEGFLDLLTTLAQRASGTVSLSTYQVALIRKSLNNIRLVAVSEIPGKSELIEPQF